MPKEKRVLGGILIQLFDFKMDEKYLYSFKISQLQLICFS